MEPSSMSPVILELTNPPPSAAEHRSPEVVKPLFRGTGDTDYLCGNCGAVIASSMGPRQRVNVDVATCSACGAENKFPPNLLP
jgi:transcription elongation factor Elf1